MYWILRPPAAPARDEIMMPRRLPSSDSSRSDSVQRTLQPVYRTSKLVYLQSQKLPNPTWNSKEMKEIVRDIQKQLRLHVLNVNAFCQRGDLEAVVADLYEDALKKTKAQLPPLSSLLTIVNAAEMQSREKTDFKNHKHAIQELYGLKSSRPSRTSATELIQEDRFIYDRGSSIPYSSPHIAAVMARAWCLPPEKGRKFKLIFDPASILPPTIPFIAFVSFMIEEAITAAERNLFRPGRGANVWHDRFTRYRRHSERLEKFQDSSPSQFQDLQRSIEDRVRSYVRTSVSTSVRSKAKAPRRSMTAVEISDDEDEVDSDDDVPSVVEVEPPVVPSKRRQSSRLRGKTATTIEPPTKRARVASKVAEPSPSHCPSRASTSVQAPATASNDPRQRHCSCCRLFGNQRPSSSSAQHRHHRLTAKQVNAIRVDHALPDAPATSTSTHRSRPSTRTAAGSSAISRQPERSSPIHSTPETESLQEDVDDHSIDVDMKDVEVIDLTADTRETSVASSEGESPEADSSPEPEHQQEAKLELEYEDTEATTSKPQELYSGQDIEDFGQMFRQQSRKELEHFELEDEEEAAMSKPQELYSGQDIEDFGHIFRQQFRTELEHFL